MSDNAELRNLLKRAPRSLENLAKWVRIAIEEKNTQAKAHLLGREVSAACQWANELYTALALMKNCELIPYEEPTGHVASDWDRAMEWVLSTLDQGIKDCKGADDGSGAMQAVEGSLRTLRNYFAEKSREKKREDDYGL